MGDDNWGKGILEMHREALENNSYPPLSEYLEDIEFIEVEYSETEEGFLNNAEKAWIAKHGNER